MIPPRRDPLLREKLQVVLEDLASTAIGYEEAIDQIFDILEEENLVDQTNRHETRPDVPEEAIISSADIIWLINRERQRPTKVEVVEMGSKKQC